MLVNTIIMPTPKEIIEAVISLGWTKGVFALFFFLAHAWIYALYRGRIIDRQKEIDRLAKENHEYRERYMKLLDKHFEFKSIEEQRG